MNFNTENEKEVLRENNFFKAIIFNEDGSIDKMPKNEKDKYIDWLNRCDFIKENGVIVQLNLTKYVKAENKIKSSKTEYYVSFNGMASWYNRYGGYCFKGIMDLNKRTIDAEVCWDNSDKYKELKTIYINHLKKNEGKVK